jgi:hypothetical protein
MRHFTVIHEVDADVATFWRTFLDEAYNEALYTRGLGYEYELLERHYEPTHLYRRRAKLIPNLELPPPVARLLGPRFAYVEEGTFDRFMRVWQWRHTPSALAGQLRSEGTVRAEPLHDGRCKRMCEVVLAADVLEVGPMIEAALEENIHGVLERSARFMNGWLQERCGFAPRVAAWMAPAV